MSASREFDGDEADEKKRTGLMLEPAIDWLVSDVGISRAAAEQIVEYLAGAKAVLGVMPSQENLVLERFFDDSGSMQLVLHSPFGSRLNRAWGSGAAQTFLPQV